MKVILLENIASLGQKGEIKNVSDGYAGNFLIPQGKVTIATPEAVARLEAQANRAQQQEDDRQDEYSKIAKTLNKQSLNFEGKVSEKDILFKGISTSDIIGEVKNKFNLEISEKWFTKTSLFKKTGKHQAYLRLPNNKLISFFINIHPVK